MKKFFHFVKYNNFAVLLLFLVFLFGGAVFAQSDAGQEFIGQKQSKVEGVDNSALLSADLDSFDMDFKIEKIEKDDKYYYITYTYLDLIKDKNVWSYQLLEKTRKVSLSLREDLGKYMAEELKEFYHARIKKLKRAQKKARQTGEQKRVEIVEYSGLIGKVLNVGKKVFKNYEPIKKRELPSPSTPPSILKQVEIKKSTSSAVVADNLTDIYNDYIAKNDPDKDDVFGEIDNCPEVFNPDQADIDNDGIGDACDNENEENQADNNEEDENQNNAENDTENASSSDDFFTAPQDDASSSDEIIQDVDNQNASSSDEVSQTNDGVDNQVDENNNDNSNAEDNANDENVLNFEEENSNNDENPEQENNSEDNETDVEIIDIPLDE